MRIWKILLKTALIIFFISIFSFISFGIYLHLNKDKVINKIIRKLEEKLDLKIKIKNTQIKFSLETLNLGINLKDLDIKEKKDLSKSLILADNIYLTLNLFGILRKNYILNFIKITNGKIKYDLKSSNNERNPLKIKNIVFKNTYVHIFNSNNIKIDYQFLANKLKLELYNKKNFIKVRIDGFANLKSYKYNNIDYDSDILLNSKIGFSYKKKLETLIINDNSIITINSIPLSIKGKVNYKNKKINLYAKSLKSIDCHKFFDSLISESENNTFKLLKDLESQNRYIKINKGFFNFNLNLQNTYTNPSIKGTVDFPILSLKFKTNQANNISKETSSIPLNLKNIKSEVDFKSYKDLRSGKIKVAITEGRMGKGTFKTDFVIQKIDDKYRLAKSSINSNIYNQLKNLQCIGNFSGEFDLNDLLSFFRIDLVNKELNGKAIAKLNYILPLYKLIFINKDNYKIINDTKTKIQQNKQINLDGEIKLVDNLYKINGIEFKNLSGILPIRDSNIKGGKIKMNIKKEEVNMNFSLTNILGIFNINNQSSNLDLKLFSDNLDLNYLISNYSKSTKKLPLKISSKIKARLEFKVNKLSKKNIIFEDIFLKSRIYDQVLFIDSLIAKIAKGKLEIKGNFDMKKVYPKLRIHCNLKRIYLDKLCYAFNNFNQSFISYKNFKGELFSNFDLTLKFNQYGLPLWDSLNSQIEFYIKDGILFDFKPILSLKSYITGRNLSKIYFNKTIKNKLYIKSSIIHLPKIRLESNVIDVIVSGWHSFDNKIHYKFILPLKGNFKLNSNKLGKKKAVNSFNSNLKAFITIDGTLKNPKIKFDFKDTLMETIGKQTEDLANIITGKYKSLKKSKQLEKDDYFNF
ncbi:MAG: hypothetical protein GY830_05525 [Bacteroidetes bacterium]|nr:hypothetical protein [Bacteroidota bacterium]